MMCKTRSLYVSLSKNKLSLSPCMEKNNNGCITLDVLTMCLFDSKRQKLSTVYAEQFDKLCYGNDSITILL